jgi:hypothetical protein
MKAYFVQSEITHHEAMAAIDNTRLIVAMITIALIPLIPVADRPIL